METCVVIGIGPGLGTALAKRFARGGYAIAGIARSRATVDAAVAAVTAIGGTARGYVADAADAGALAATLVHITSDGSAPAVGIYNVATFVPGTPTRIELDEFIDEFRANVVGALVMARVLAPAMRTVGRGTLLITGGGLALHPSAPAATLAIGKAAVRSLALMLGEELEPVGIHAATVTIYGTIAAGTRYDPASIAERFWAVHAQPRESWTREEAYR